MRSKLVCGVGISDDGEFIKTYSVDGKQFKSKEYVLWCGMLERCYSEISHKKHPSYIGCQLSEYFKSFQNFAGWCQNQIGFGSISYQLDKDLLCKGNKEYSEDSCVFIPRKLNTFLTTRKAGRGDLPIGVSYDKQTRISGKVFIYIRANISDMKGKSIFLGRFKTPEEAFQAYKTAKEAQAKELAITYEGLVDPRVIVALNNYTVNIDD